MACETCGKPKCACGKDNCSTGAAVVIKNATEYVNFRKVLIPASAGDEQTIPPNPGAYCNALVVYESTNAAYLYSSDGIPTRIDGMGETKEIWDAIHDEEDARKDADDEIWTEIETIEASSDVVDVVGTYAELQSYDTSKLHANDLIKVLQDETRDDAITYYRWSGTAFTYVGAEGPYYTASETDTLLSAKQDTLIAGNGISIASDGKTISVSGVAANTIFYMNASESGSTRHIYKNPDMTGLASSKDVFDANELGQVILRISTSVTPDQYSDCYLQNAYKATGDYQLLFLDERTYRSFDTTNINDTTFYYAARVLQTELTAGTNIQINGNTISATDTTYTHFTGATSSADGVQGLVPGPLAGDQDKFLKGDGTWAAVQSGGTYTAGNGISIDANNEISVDTTVVATQNDLAGKQDTLTAGANISIATVDNVPNTISVTGMPVLYTTQGQNIDGAVTQKLFTDTVGDVESILQTLNSGNGV